MKRTSFLLFIISLLSLSLTFADYEAPDNGLVAYYTFDNCDARDDSSNGNSDGVLHGNVDCWCGIDGQGLLFDGRSAYVEFEGDVNRYFNTTDFTISFYFKTDGSSVFNQSLLSKRDTCNENHMLDIQLNNQLGLVDTDVHENEYRDYRYISPYIDGPGWYHYALVRKGVRAYTYINGELRLEAIRCSGVDIGNEALMAFSNSICVETGGIRRFKGVLDELRIYDSALTPPQMMALYSQYPVENAEVNCVTFIPKKIPQDLFNTRESSYICSINKD